MTDNHFTIGLLIPDENVVVENDFHNIFPSNIQICSTNLKHPKRNATDMIKMKRVKNIFSSQLTMGLS